MEVLKYWSKTLLIPPLPPPTPCNKEATLLRMMCQLFTFLHFCSNACLQLSWFHNTCSCLSKASEISVLIKVVFKGKIRALQIPVTHQRETSQQFTMCLVVSNKTNKTKLHLLVLMERQVSTKNHGLCLLLRHQDINIFEGCGKI